MRWLREEIRLLGLDSWASEYHGPPDPPPCTARYLLALLVAGCAVTMRPNAYEWHADTPPSEYYRWQVVDDPELCGRPVADSWNGWACAHPLNAGVIRQGDKRIDGGPVTAEEGRLCVIFASMPEDDARRLPSKWETRSLWDHEMKHCAGYAHREVFR